MLPGLILLAVWLASWLAQKSRVVHLVDVPGFLKRAPWAFVICCCAGAIFLPRRHDREPPAGSAFKRTFSSARSQAVDKICQGIPKGSSVLIIDYNTMDGLGQAIRGMCDVPVAAKCTPRSRRAASFLDRWQ